MWVRGLKQLILVTHHIFANVAPYVGAWIETDPAPDKDDKTNVAPYVGAWIETYYPITLNLSRQSHPMWVRGLKLYLHSQCRKY